MEEGAVEGKTDEGGGADGETFADGSGGVACGVEDVGALTYLEW